MKPTKEQLQQYLSNRRSSGSPPPTPDQVRQQLGWDMLREEEEARKVRENRDQERVE